MAKIDVGKGLVKALKEGSPKRTGRLRFYSIRLVQSLPGKFVVSIGQKGTPAERYAFFTNAPWLSPRWHGKRNPNEGWVQKAVEKFARSYASNVGGIVNVQIGSSTVQ